MEANDSVSRSGAPRGGPVVDRRRLCPAGRRHRAAPRPRAVRL